MVLQLLPLIPKPKILTLQQRVYKYSPVLKDKNPELSDELVKPVFL